MLKAKTMALAFALALCASLSYGEETKATTYKIDMTGVT